MEKNPVKTSKLPPAQITSVAKGKIKKKTLGMKVKETFMTTDLPDVKGSIVNDIIIPSAKNMVLDAFRSIATGALGTIEMMLFGRVSNHTLYGGKSIGSSIGSRIRYETMYGGGVSTGRQLTSKERATFALDAIVFEGVEIVDGYEKTPRQQAQSVIDNMIEHIEMYGYATVRDFYDFAGVTTRDYTEASYGWRSFGSARPEPIAGGAYIIVCPKPEFLGAK